MDWTISKTKQCNHINWIVLIDACVTHTRTQNSAKRFTNGIRRLTIENKVTKQYNANRVNNNDEFNAQLIACHILNYLIPLAHGQWSLHMYVSNKCECMCQIMCIIKYILISMFRQLTKRLLPKTCYQSVIEHSETNQSKNGSKNQITWYAYVCRVLFVHE